MNIVEKRRLLKLYDEKGEIYQEMLARRKRGECTDRELKQAVEEMEGIGNLLLSIEKQG
jgi:hypothetical protein